MCVSHCFSRSPSCRSMMFLLSSLRHVTVGSGIPVALHLSRTEPFSGAIPASGDSSLRISGGTLTSKVPIWKRTRRSFQEIMVRKHDVKVNRLKKNTSLCGRYVVRIWSPGYPPGREHFAILRYMVRSLRTIYAFGRKHGSVFCMYGGNFQFKVNTCERTR